MNTRIETLCALVLLAGCPSDPDGESDGSTTDASESGDPTTASNTSAPATSATTASTTTAEPTTTETTSPTPTGDSSGGDPVECGDSPASTLEVAERYLDAWNETDAATRDCLLELAWADDGMYADPAGTAGGRDELSGLIGEFHDMFPGAVLSARSGVVEHHGIVRFDWEITGGGADLVGMDFGELAEDGRLSRIVGFFGPVPDGADVPDAYLDYLAAFNEPNPETRATLFDASVTDDLSYTDPTLTIESKPAVLGYIEAYRAQFPGTDIELASSATTTDGVARIFWTITGGGTDLYSGVDFVEFDGDLINRVSTFFGDPPAIGEGGFAREGCMTCVELTQEEMPDAAMACTEGASTSADRWGAVQACTCSSACADECGDNLCFGMPPTMECGQCMALPVNLLLGCTEEFVSCVSDG